jgi:hypothetical protein
MDEEWSMAGERSKLQELLLSLPEHKHLMILFHA